MDAKLFVVNKKNRVNPARMSDFLAHCERQRENLERLDCRIAEGTVHCTWIGVDSLDCNLPGLLRDNLDNRILQFGMLFYSGQSGCLLYRFGANSYLKHSHTFDCFTKRVVLVPVSGDYSIANGESVEDIRCGRAANFVSPDGGFVGIQQEKPVWVAVFKQYTSQMVQAQLFDLELM